MLFQLFDKLSHEQQQAAIRTLPETVRDIADVIGIEGACTLVDAFGGGEVHFPSRKNPEAPVFQELVDVIGEDAARLLLQRYEGEPVYIARCASFWREVRNMNIVAEYDKLTASMSGRKATLLLVRLFGVSNRSIEKIVGSPLLLS